MKLKEKMIQLHEKIFPFINHFNIYPHKLSEHLTSSVNPNQFNKYYVDWLGVRYGKSPNELDLLNSKIYDDDSEVYGFQKHGCIQFSLFTESFFVGIFHSVPQGAVDRMYLHERLEKDTYFRSELAVEFNKLSGNNICISIANSSITIHNNGEEIVQNIINKDQNGFYLSIGKEYKPNAAELFNDTIAEIIISNVELLIPLYNKMIQRYKTSA